MSAGPICNLQSAIYNLNAAFLAAGKIRLPNGVKRYQLGVWRFRQ
jgi:hypothetical protein